MPLLSKASIALLLGVALTLIGCGGSSNNPNSDPNPNNLTQPQAQQLEGEAFAEVGMALADALSGSPLTTSRAKILAALPKNNQVVPTPAGITCNPSGTSCTVSFTYQCPDGGSIAVSGTATENSPTSASVTITETPASCSDGTLVINGNPDMTIGAQVNDNGTTTTVDVTIGGDISFSPVKTGQFPTGSCTSNLSISASVSDSTGAATCSVGGSLCGFSVSGSCPSGTVL